VVSWNTNQDCQQAVAIIARANANAALGNPTFNPDIPNGLLFYALLHDYRAYTGPTNFGHLGSADQMSIWGTINVGYASLGAPVAVTGTQNPINFRWVPGHAYRLVLSSTNSIADATQWFTASIYDVNDLTAPLFTVTGDNSYPGNTTYIPPYGYVGLAVDKVNNDDYDPSVDATFDNSDAETQTEAERAFEVGFVSMLGNVKALIGSISTVIVFTLVLAIAGTMRRAIRERGLSDHILAWAYSIDLPVRVRTDPLVSITGLTFVRNQAEHHEIVTFQDEFRTLLREHDMEFDEKELWD